MGVVMFEVGLFFFVVLFYYLIGYYYRIWYGILLSFLGMILYFLGLLSGLGIPVRIIFLAVPFVILIIKRRVTNLKFEKNKVYCTVCGWPNETDAGFCRGLHCGAPITAGPDTKKWTYFLPPRVILIIVAAVILGIMAYEFTYSGRFFVLFAYAVWPLLFFLLILILLYRKLK